LFYEGCVEVRLGFCVRRLRRCRGGFRAGAEGRLGRHAGSPTCSC